MGNHISCMSPAAHSPTPTITVLHSVDGRISHFQDPVKVAELMLECPNQFVCHSGVLRSGQRISPLSADEELRMGQLYILLPMRKLHGRFSPEELAFFASLLNRSDVAGKSSRPYNSGGRSKVTRSSVAPESEGLEINCNQNRGSRSPLRSLSLRLDENTENQPMAVTNQKFICRSKSWMPKLETISETPMSMVH